MIVISSSFYFKNTLVLRRNKIVQFQRIFQKILYFSLDSLQKISNFLGIFKKILRMIQERGITRKLYDYIN